MALRGSMDDSVTDSKGEPEMLEQSLESEGDTSQNVLEAETTLTGDENSASGLCNAISYLKIIF